MTESVQPTIHKVFQIGVILCAVGLSLFHWTKADRDSGIYPLDEFPESLAERNERSVPRSFILPATPGVAFEQEAQRADATRQAQIARCVGALRVLGYDPGDSTTFLNAKLVEAVYTYQVAHKLPTNGRLDELTIGMLKCEGHEKAVAN